MPDAADLLDRLRTLLVAPAPLVAASSRGCAVELEEDSGFMTTGRLFDDPTGSLSSDALEGVVISVSLIYQWHMYFYLHDILSYISDSCVCPARPTLLQE